MLQFPSLLELAHPPVPSLDVSDTLADASALLAQTHVERLVVLDGQKPVGILTSSNMLNAWQQGMDPTVRVGQLGLLALPALPAGADWQAALHCLVESSQGILLVTDANGSAQGILTEEDFCRRLGIRHLVGARMILQALHDAELKFNAVFDSSLIFLGMLDPDGRVLDANQAALNVIGATLADVQGHYFWETLWWQHDAALQAQIREAVILAQQGLASGFPATHLAVCGEMLEVDFTLRPVRDQAGEVRYLLPEWLDISDRCRIEGSLQNCQGHYRTLLNATSVGVLEMDARGRCVYTNHKFTDIAGIGASDALDDGWWHHIHPDDLAKVRQARSQSLSYGVVSSVEYRYVWPDGKQVWTISQIAPMRLPGGGISGLLMTLIDTTERKELETRLRLAASIFEACSEGILVVDAQNRIISVNPAFTALLGYEAEDVIGHDPSELGSARNAPSLYRSLWQAVEEHGHWEGEIWNCCKDGQEIALWMTVNTLRNHKGEVQWRFALFSDITERKRSDELIWRQANYDMLTGLPNRRLFRDRLQHEIKKAARAGQNLALFFIDLDHFKEVNDAFGHDCGDLLLIEAGERIRSCLRETDTVARLGGDEFTAILADMRDRERAVSVAMAITRILAMPFMIEGQDTFISASVGIAFYPQDAENDLLLLKQADRAMYAAKAKGRNCYSMVAD